MKRIFCMLFAGLLLNQLYAQNNTTDTIPTYLLDESVVISLKDGDLTRVKSTVASISTRDQLNLQRHDNLKDIAPLVSNLFMPDYGSKLTSPVYIRGVGSRINSPSVGLYIDNIPYFEKAAFDFNLFDIESITVFKGPQGTLYGRNTMGGLIRVTSLSPKRYQGTKINLSGGNYGYLNTTVSHYGKFNNRTQFSLSGNYNHNEGYFTNRYSGDKVDVLNSEGIKARLCHQFSTKVSAEFFAHYEHSKQGGYPYALLLTDGASQDVNYDEYSSYRRDLLSTGLVFEIRDENFTINLTSSYQYLDDKQNIDQDFTPSPDVAAVQKQQHHMLSQEFLIKSKTSSNYQWLVGAFGFYQDFDSELSILYSENFSQKFRTPLSTNRATQTPTHGVAFFHQSTFNNFLINNLSLEAGVRVDYEGSKLDFLEKRLLSEIKDTTLKDNFNANYWKILPRVAFGYKCYSNIFLYALIAKGYKTGGFNTSFNTDDDRIFDPEHTWNYELGYKHTIGKAYVSAAVFYIDWRKQQIYQPVITGGSMLKNAGHSISKGFEIEANAEVFDKLQFRGSYGYTYAKFTDYKNGKNVYDDNYLPFIPKHTVSVGADYYLDLRNYAFIESVIFNLNYSGAGRLYWDDANLYSQRYYSTLNTKILLTHDKVSLGFWGRNITNTKYTAFYFKSMGNALAQKGKPFLFGVDLSIKF